jgi:hypothetical protein
MTTTEYMLTTGAYVATFLALCHMMIKVVHYSMTIKAHVMALPVG